MYLDEIEWEAAIAPVTKEKRLIARQKARSIWSEIKEVCETVVAGKGHHAAKNSIWKKDTTAYRGCRYILNQFPKLTIYLNHEHLVGQNSFIERALRPQKRIMDVAPNRKSESSQCAFDIIRTMVATCECAGKKFNEYFTAIMRTSREEIVADPEKYMPFVFN
jgi:hypothetical protein